MLHWSFPGDEYIVGSANMWAVSWKLNWNAKFGKLWNNPIVKVFAAIHLTTFRRTYWEWVSIHLSWWLPVVCNVCKMLGMWKVLRLKELFWFENGSFWTFFELEMVQFQAWNIFLYTKQIQQKKIIEIRGK